MNDVSVKQII